MKTKQFIMVLIASVFLGLAITTKLKAGALGADLSWVTQMEASGYIWKNASGVQKDIFVICKELGFNSVRLRVWVNPSGGWCGKTDVVNKAKRAAAQGMSVFIDFHFSDSWADPGKQNPPAAWKNYTVDQMKTAIANHVKDVLNAIKAAGITPWFVQIGNETNDGLLWPLGKASTNPANYAAFITAGYDAAKSVFPGASVGVHLSNMWDTNLWKWNLGILKQYGAKYDFVGGSLYPTTSDYKTKISQCKTTVSTVQSQFGKWCMVAEFGIAANSGSTGADALKQARTICNDLYYWEPEAYNWQGYGLGAWDATTKQPTVILTSGLKSALLSAKNTSKTNISIFPNPSNGHSFNIDLSSVTGTTRIRIFNINGSVLNQTSISGGAIIQLNQLNLKAGAYFVQIENNDLKEIYTISVK